VGHNQPQRIAVLRRQGLAVMVGGEEHIVPVQVGQRHVGGIALLGVDQDVAGPWPELHQFEDLAK